MKHLHEKNEQFPEPNWEILDTFLNPGVDQVRLNQCEFTSLCPLTQQPDYAQVWITYEPVDLCLESKSLKLYLSSYRQYKGFAETITNQICRDIYKVLKCPVQVSTRFARRGGIDIESIATCK